MGMLDQSDINILASAIAQAMGNRKEFNQPFDNNGGQYLVGSRINTNFGDSKEIEKLKKSLEDLSEGFKNHKNAFIRWHKDVYDDAFETMQELKEKLESFGNVSEKVSKKISETLLDELEELSKKIKEETDYLSSDDHKKSVENQNEANNIYKSASRENELFQSTQNVHQAKLLQIEVGSKRKYLGKIEKIYEEEEKIRREGLANYETLENARKKHVENVAKEGIYDKDGHLRGLRGLWKQMVKAPFIDTFGRSFGEHRTDTIPTGIVRTANTLLLSPVNSFMKTAATGKANVSGMASNVSGALMKTGNPYAMAAGGVIEILKTAFEMYSKVDKAASDYARKVGGGALAQDKMRRSSTELAVAMGKFGERTYNAEKILENMSETSEAFGRNLEYLSTLDIKAITDLKDFGIKNETISQFDTFGISIDRVSQEIASLYGSAGKKGLNASAAIKAMADNMKLSQNYTFAKGRKAIFEMAEKSAQLKINLRDAESFANKVGTLEGAMKSAAQLSVLGGSFAMQGNPMTLLYNALNDVEGLQDQMLAMTKNLAYWDQEKGQLEISAFDRQRLKAMSEATGIDYSELTTQAFTQGRINRISEQLPAGMNKETAEYIKNIAVLDENGKARIQFHNAKGDAEGEAKLLKDLTADDIARLKTESENKDIKEGATVGDILNNTRSIQDKLDDLVNQVKNYLVRGVMRLVERFTSSSNKIKSMYNFDTNEKEQFDRVRSVLSDGTLSKEKIDQYVKNGTLTKEDIDVLKKMNILSSKGDYIGRGSDERYGKSFLGLWGGDLYGNAEIGQMYSQAVAGKNKPTAYATGGYTGDGDTNEIAGFVHKGEYVIDADTTKSMFSNIKNGENLMNFKNFAQNVNTNYNGGPNNKDVSVKPVKVEFGTLHLELGGITKDIDMNAFANMLLSSQSFIQSVIQQISTTENYGRYAKDDAKFKYIDRPYSNIV